MQVSLKEKKWKEKRLSKWEQFATLRDSNEFQMKKKCIEL